MLNQPTVFIYSNPPTTCGHSAGSKCGAHSNRRARACLQFEFLSPAKRGSPGRGLKLQTAPKASYGVRRLTGHHILSSAACLVRGFLCIALSLLAPASLTHKKSGSDEPLFVMKLGYFKLFRWLPPDGLSSPSDVDGVTLLSCGPFSSPSAGGRLMPSPVSRAMSETMACMLTQT